MGKYESHKSRVDPIELVDCENVQVLGPCAPVEIDEIIYDFVLNNVVDNAHKYGTECTIRWQLRDGALTTRVRSLNGPGTPAVQQRAGAEAGCSRMRASG